MKRNYLLVCTLIIIGSVFLTSCELLEDILKDHPSDSRTQLIGLWKNDSLETKYYENGVLVNSTHQSLEGYTLELKNDSTYINTNPDGIAYLTGTWSILKLSHRKQILLDANTANERGYTIISLSKNRLITNRKVDNGEGSIIEYTFSYNK